MIKQFLEELTERSTTMTLWKSAGGRSSTTLRSRLDIKIGTGRRSEEKIPVLCESKLPESIPVPSSNSRTFRRKCCWSCTARQFTDSERIYRVSLPRREREWIEFYNLKWINSRKNKPQKRKTIGLLHNSELDGGCRWNSVRSHETKDRAIQEYLETPSKYCILVQFEARPRERSAILPNAVTCSRSPQHTACSLHWESGTYENYGWALPEGTLDSESVTSRVKIELAICLQDPQNQDARSSWEPSSVSNSYGETCNSTVDHRIAGIPLSAVEPQNTVRENKVKRLIEKFENHKIKKIAYSGYEIDGEDQPVQQRIARLDRRHEPHRDLRTLRKFFQAAMSWLQCLLGNGNNLLQLRKKYEVYAKSNGVRPEQPWRHLNPWIRDQEKQKTWSSARSFWKTKDVPPCEADAKKGSTGRARRPSNDTLTMVRLWRIQKVIVWHRVERTPHNIVRQDRPGEAHLHRYKSWKNSDCE